LKVALPRNFKETIKDRVERDPAFREELLKEGVEYLLTGDVDTGKVILRDYINATIGFNALGSLTDRSPKSLQRIEKLIYVIRNNKVMLDSDLAALYGVETRVLK
jgi:hypothetical protein